MTVERTSPDGVVTIKELTVDGNTYDLPPWIKEADFIAGVKSNDDDNALSSLVKCELAFWDKNDLDPEDYEGEEEVYSTHVPLFKLQFAVPLDGLRELAVHFFTPITGAFRGEEMTFTVGDEGATISFLAREYTDFNDVQAAVLSNDFATQPYSGTGKWLAETYEELQKDLAEQIKYATGWGGFYQEFDTTDGNSYFLLIKVHED